MKLSLWMIWDLQSDPSFPCLADLSTRCKWSVFAFSAIFGLALYLCNDITGKREGLNKMDGQRFPQNNGNINILVKTK